MLDDTPLSELLAREWERADWHLRESGTYRYRRGVAANGSGQDTGIVERYQRYRSDDGRTFIRVGRDARRSPSGLLLRVESWSENGMLGHIALSLGDVKEPNRITMVYEIEPRKVRYTRSGPGSPPESRTTELPDTHHWLPLARNYLGPLLSELAENEGGHGRVVIPDLRNPVAPDVFTPLVESRTVLPVEAPPHEWSVGGRSRSAHAYHFLGGPYDDRSLFWICNDSRRLLHYRFVARSSEQWSCTLTDLEVGE